MTQPSFPELTNVPQRQSWSCSCACSICMAGQCCLDPNRSVSLTVRTGTGYVTGTTLHEHAWQAVGTDIRRRKTYVIQSCACGEVRRVEVSA